MDINMFLVWLRHPISKKLSLGKDVMGGNSK
jgi:hypothetical protein